MTEMETKKELEYLYGLERFGMKPGLAVMEQLMEVLGHPERTFKSIHVTGTNGKGSTCAMMESVLRGAGYKTAMYTSPHIYTFNERVRVGGKNISDEELVALVAEMRIIIENEGIHPTFFEFTTALAFLYFSRSDIDIAIVEVGMGGRYDATNVIIPILSVITNIGLDHMDYIGPTKVHIAKEKAGIIKEGVPVVTGEAEKEMLNIFREEAGRLHATLLRSRDSVTGEVVSRNLAEQVVAVEGVYTGELHLPLLGDHQVRNLETALTALYSMNQLGFSIRWESVVLGIGSVVWEGRLQILSRDPLVVIDGAHNADGARVLYEFLQSLHRYDVVIFAAKKGKDISDAVSLILPLFSHVIITKGSYMPESPAVLEEKLQEKEGTSVSIEEDVGAAIEKGKKMLSPQGTMLITGSLYMVADALAYLKAKGV